ncbi:MAG: hypothetical protein HYX94_03710 [Chloroflexi bacterium]|nr:hypothetical protein [Chloroflexota bacterium]
MGGGLEEALRLAHAVGFKAVCTFVSENPGLTGIFDYLLAPILNSLVPQTGHVPSVAGLLFFKVTALGFLISLLALHLTQYASMYSLLSYSP